MGFLVTVLRSCNAMKTKQLATGALLVGLICGLGVLSAVPAAIADKLDGDNMIDGDFEEALLTHVEKRFFRTIDATVEQKAAISDLLLKQVRSTRSDRENMRHKLAALAADAAVDDTSDDTIRAEAKELRQTREKLMDSRLEVALKVRQILTPAQRLIVKERLQTLLSGQGPMRKRFSSMLDK
jgi:Spy/CpxP family protein refolding chaperone